MQPEPLYKPDTAGTIMITLIPICADTATCSDALKEVARDIEWDDVHHIYIVDATKKLLGYVRIAQIVQFPPHTSLKTIVRQFPETLTPTTDQEKAVFMAIKNDFDAIPVVSEDKQLLGAVTAKAIIDVLHQEHVEDVLFASGIRRNKKESIGLVHLASARIFPVLRSRAPWLIGGALVGIALGLVSRQFENALEKTIALAHFIPVVAYIADSVGTQSEAITVRALATLKLNYFSYLLRELSIGAMLGVMLGALGGLGAWLIDGNAQIAFVVAVSLLVASTLATGLAALIPILFKLAGKDPALGSGPIATALQDILSVVVYFAFAMFIIGT